MPTQLTADDAKQSLNDHAANKGAKICEKYGREMNWQTLLRLLEDRTCVRYPCEIVFDTAGLQAGEMAHPEPLGDAPEAGFKIYVHPILMTQLDRAIAAVLYQLVLVNYGEFASPEDAEVFGAYALGLPKDDYYKLLCAIADDVEEYS